MSDTLPAEDPVTKKTARKRGRPSTYSFERAEVICERLAYGESLRQICSDETMPRRRTVFQWLAKYPEFARLYAEARDDQIAGLAGDATEIARTEPNLARARLMCNTCFLRIGRMRSRKY
jgi:hypothetical protein